jgi:hypothetical protein
MTVVRAMTMPSHRFGNLVIFRWSFAGISTGAAQYRAFRGPSVFKKSRNFGLVRIVRLFWKEFWKGASS